MQGLTRGFLLYSAYGRLSLTRGGRAWFESIRKMGNEYRSGAERENVGTKFLNLSLTPISLKFEIPLNRPICGNI